MSVHKVGERCFFEEFKGTIRYIGEIPPIEGIWFGVEWDTERGKHDGTSNGVHYFTCKDKHGSFVRAHKIQFGNDAMKELENSYGDGDGYGDEGFILNHQTKQETLIEMVGFDKVAAKQRNFDSLRAADLASCNISCANWNNGLDQLVPNLKVLSLRNTLISSLSEVIKIAGKLKYLKTLNLSENRLSDYDVSKLDTDTAFSQLITLFVNKMCIQWDEFLMIMKISRNITDVHVCYNKIEHIRYDSVLENIRVLNLEGNLVCSWQDVLSLSNIESLDRLILNNNKIKKVEPPNGEEELNFSSLTSISLNDNLVDEWQSINELNKLPLITELRFKVNPVCKDITGFALRQELISRIGNLKISNGSIIQDAERKIAELAYIKKYSAFYFQSKENNKMNEFMEDHPRYTVLTNIYEPPTPQVNTQSRSLKENLLSLEFHCPDCTSKKNTQKKVPATMTVQQLKGILQRLYKIPNSKQKLSYMDTKNSREIALEDNTKQLTFYSVSSGDTILLRW